MPWGAQLAAFALVIMLLVHLLAVLLTGLTSPFWPQSVLFLGKMIPRFLEPATRAALLPAPFVLLLALLLWRGLIVGAIAFCLVSLWELAKLALSIFPLQDGLDAHEVIALAGSVIALVFALIALKSFFGQRGGGIYR